MVRTVMQVGLMAVGLAVAFTACNDPEHVIEPPPEIGDAALPIDAAHVDAAPVEPPPMMLYVDCAKGTPTGGCTKDVPCGSIADALRQADPTRKTIIIAAPRKPFADMTTYNVEIRSEVFQADMGICVAP